MKLVVQHKDGSNETITLTEPLELVRGDTFNRLKTSTGMDHWFTQDGYYDGWGATIYGEGLSNEDGGDLDAVSLIALPLPLTW